MRQLAKHEDINAISPSPLISKPEDATEQWLAQLKLNGCSYHTTRSYGYMLRQFLRRYAIAAFQDIHELLYAKLNEVAGEDEERTEKRKVTISQYVKVLRSFFRHLYDSGLWPNDPTQGLKAPKLAKREKRCPTPKEVQKLLSLNLAPNLRLFFTACYRLWLASIEIKNIDFTRRRILVMGKGKKEGVVPFSKTTAAMLQDYIANNEHRGSVYLFPHDPRGGKNAGLKHLSGGTFEQALRRVAKREAIRYINPHAFRHYCATYLLEHGGDIKAVSKLLRHANIGITLETYHHVGQKQMFDMHKEKGYFANDVTKLSTRWR